MSDCLTASITSKMNDLHVSTSPPPPPEESVSGFMALPAEIRHIIYGFRFSFPRGLQHKSHLALLERKNAQDRLRVHYPNPMRTAQRADYSGEAFRNRLALLATCKQVYHEALPFAYKNIRLRAEILEDLHIYRSVLFSPVTATQIRFLTLDVMYGSDNDDLNAAFLLSILQNRQLSLDKLCIRFINHDSDNLLQTRDPIEYALVRGGLQIRLYSTLFNFDCAKIIRLEGFFHPDLPRGLMEHYWFRNLRGSNFDLGHGHGHGHAYYRDRHIEIVHPARVEEVLREEAEDLKG